MAFVPLPPLLEPLPVVKKPNVDPPNGSPLGFDPATDQMIIRFAGNAGVGVQVKIVSPALQTSVVDKKADVVESMKRVVVALVSIVSLKTNTTAADGDAPFVGGGDVIIGSACTSECQQHMDAIKNGIMSKGNEGGNLLEGIAGFNAHRKTLSRVKNDGFGTWGRLELLFV